MTAVDAHAESARSLSRCVGASDVDHVCRAEARKGVVIMVFAFGLSVVRAAHGAARQRLHSGGGVKGLCIRRSNCTVRKRSVNASPLVCMGDAAARGSAENVVKSMVDTLDMADAPENFLLRGTAPLENFVREKLKYHRGELRFRILEELVIFLLALAFSTVLPYVIKVIARVAAKVRFMAIKWMKRDKSASEGTPVNVALASEYSSLMVRSFFQSSRQELRPLVFFLIGTRWLLLLAQKRGFAVYLIKPLRVIVSILTASFVFHWNKEAAYEVSQMHRDQSVMLDPETEQRRRELILTVKGVGYVFTAVLFVSMLRFYAGLDLGALVAFGGASGIAIGFASQNFIENGFGGLIMYIQRPFNENDLISTPDLLGFRGRVESIGVSRTTLRTENMRQIIVPNSKFIDSVLYNESRQLYSHFEHKVPIKPELTFFGESIAFDIRNSLHDNPVVEETEYSRAYICDLTADGGCTLYVSAMLTLSLSTQELDDAKQKILLGIARIIHSYEVRLQSSIVNSSASE
ncbi:Mechanosensitive ion channel protein 1, mitochondrial [Porphyridium purpureum]|uniref:Mechanosensitive ion channel protein 1, mitochondrial n=1 Tax=Porphyridium purpureum TaxID=35688 RepID=A0A5J4Z6L1_PORPP|nr:Mechanosensitive ion channel protein 1, mitochondrial [Porphyridium purpureum]|eukprot:POR2846..scf295_1